eukprot:gnl/TRDRNA2_/TRDRNA2_165490_c3_seq1.p1 gnl/TRDRNA2_/TRDRNA2_165490_c3~~gnl/TRDRNA2_/TRDRNA2_165490_c3_seq1.p1  ORF type:complete len:107 (-),score=9.18 gnl/TRDRNA2_/TRDRNA2_165490_c3_seq1:83-403(-)
MDPAMHICYMSSQQAVRNAPLTHTHAKLTRHQTLTSRLVAMNDGRGSIMLRSPAAPWRAAEAVAIVAWCHEARLAHEQESHSENVQRQGPSACPCASLAPFESVVL